MTKMEMQARHFGTEMIEEFVTAVDICSQPGELYTVTTENRPSLSDARFDYRGGRGGQDDGH